MLQSQNAIELLLWGPIISENDYNPQNHTTHICLHLPFILPNDHFFPCPFTHISYSLFVDSKQTTIKVSSLIFVLLFLSILRVMGLQSLGHNPIIADLAWEVTEIELKLSGANSRNSFSLSSFLWNSVDEEPFVIEQLCALAVENAKEAEQIASTKAVLRKRRSPRTMVC